MKQELEYRSTEIYSVNLMKIAAKYAPDLLEDKLVKRGVESWRDEKEMVDLAMQLLTDNDIESIVLRMI